MMGLHERPKMYCTYDTREKGGGRVEEVAKVVVIL